MDAQKTFNRQSNPEKKEQCQRYHNIGLQTIHRVIITNYPQSHNHRNGHVDQWSRRPRDNPTQLDIPPLTKV
jgi:hypothetical protein